jgi:hypothetical protein
MFIVWIITNLKRLYDGGGRRMKNSYKTLWMKKFFSFFLVGDVQTRIANSNKATTKWIEGALSFFQSFLYFLTLKLNPFLLFLIFFLLFSLSLLFFSLCSSTLPLWLSISSAFLKQ